MSYKVVTTEVVVCLEHQGLLSESNTTISIEDEGGGAFVRISQPLSNHVKENEIRLDPEEIDVILKASKDLIANYNITIPNEVKNG